MIKRNLVNNIMKGVKRSINESINLREDALLTENDDKSQYVFEISSRKNEISKSVVKLFKFANDKLSIDEGIKSFKIYCKNESEIASVYSIIVKQHVLDKWEDIVIKLYTKSKAAINDSVNESFDNIEGNFISDFIYYSDDYDEPLLPIEAAKEHIKYLIKNGLDIDITEKRYSIIYNIHYKGEQQFKALQQWLAWHMGEVDVISNKPSARIMAEMADIIKSGKRTVF